jgi:hypothetical protein
MQADVKTKAFAAGNALLNSIAEVYAWDYVAPPAP